jgi:hypothetical protein
MRALENIDIETWDALAKLCDPNSEVTRKDAEALAIVLILELREKKARTRAPRRWPLRVCSCVALESAGVEFIAENGGGPGVRLRKGAK